MTDHDPNQDLPTAENFVARCYIILAADGNLKVEDLVCKKGEDFDAFASSHKGLKIEGIHHKMIERLLREGKAKIASSPFAQRKNPKNPDEGFHVEDEEGEDSQGEGESLINKVGATVAKVFGSNEKKKQKHESKDALREEKTKNELLLDQLIKERDEVRNENADLKREIASLREEVGKSSEDLLKPDTEQQLLDMYRVQTNLKEERLEQETGDSNFRHPHLVGITITQRERTLLKVENVLRKWGDEMGVSWLDHPPQETDSREEWDELKGLK